MSLLPTKQNAYNLAVLSIAVQLLLLLHSAHVQALKKSNGKGRVSHSLRVTKMLCTNTPYQLSQLNRCTMEEFPNGTVALDISLKIPKVLNYLEITVKLFYKYTTYRPFMIDWSIELCQAYRLGKFNPSTTGLVMNIIAESLPDFYHACPHGNQTYNCLWLFDPKFIPETLPSGEYRLDIFFYDSTSTLLFSLELYGVMRRQGLLTG